MARIWKEKMTCTSAGLLQCVAGSCNVFYVYIHSGSGLLGIDGYTCVAAMRCTVLQRIAVCCSVLQ